MKIRALSVTSVFLDDLDETRYSSSSPRNSVEQLFGAEQLNGRSLSNCGSSANRRSAVSDCPYSAI